MPLRRKKKKQLASERVIISKPFRDKTNMPNKLKSVSDVTPLKKDCVLRSGRKAKRLDLSMKTSEKRDISKVRLNKSNVATNSLTIRKNNGSSKAVPSRCSPRNNKITKAGDGLKQTKLVKYLEKINSNKENMRDKNIKTHITRNKHITEMKSKKKQTKSKVNSSIHPIYLDAETDSSDNGSSVRPSQIYEFHFNSEKEMKLKKVAKKEAKQIKTIIKKKAAKKKEVNTKESEQCKVDSNSKSPNTTKLPINSETESSQHSNKETNTKPSTNKLGIKILEEIVVSPAKNSTSKKSQSTPFHDRTPNISIPESSPVELQNATREVDQNFVHSDSDSAKNSSKKSQSTPFHDRTPNISIPKSSPIELQNATKGADQNLVRGDNFSSDSTKHGTSKRSQSNPFHGKTPNISIPENSPIELQNAARDGDQNSVYDDNFSSDLFEDTPQMEVSKICNDFDAICSNRSESVAQTKKPSPWRSVVPIPIKKKYFEIKNSSLPSYNQDSSLMIPLVIDTESTTNISNDSGKSVEQEKCDSNKNLRQPLISSYLDNSQSRNIEFTNESVNLFDGDTFNSPPKNNNQQKEESYISETDTSQNDASLLRESEKGVLKNILLNNNLSKRDSISPIVSISPKKSAQVLVNRKINFSETVTSSPLRKSPRILGDRNTTNREKTETRLQENNESNKENVSLNETNKENVSLNKSHKENIPSDESNKESIQLKKYTNKHKSNTKRKKKTKVSFNSVVDEKENSLENISNSISNSDTVESSVDDCFGFDSSVNNNEYNNAFDKRPSKKPVRVSIRDIKKVVGDLKAKQNASEEPIEGIEPVESDEEEEVEENDRQSDEMRDLLFDEPRYTNFERKSYTDEYNKKKRKRLPSTEEMEDHQRKKKKTHKTKKEEDEFENWAKQFNSMCEEIEKEELLVE